MEIKEQNPKKEKEASKDELTINLNKRNKLRKIKKDIGESKISGEEYELRVREVLIMKISNI